MPAVFGVPAPGGPLAGPVGRVGRGPAVAALPRTLLRPGDDAPAVLTRLYATVIRGHGTVHVLQLSDASARDLGVDVAQAGGIVGEIVSHHDLTPGVARADAETPRHRTRGARVDTAIVSVRRRRLDGPAVEVVKYASHAVLAVETRGTRPAVAEDAAAMLRFLGVAVLGLVAWQGRLPAA